MTKSDIAYLRHMAEYAAKAHAIAAGTTFEAFAASEVVQLALQRAIEIVGEAANHVSVQVRERFSDLPWAKIVGIRHRVVHEYFRIDQEILWQVATVELANLLPLLQQAIHAVEEEA